VTGLTCLSTESQKSSDSESSDSENSNSDNVEEDNTPVPAYTPPPSYSRPPAYYNTTPSYSPPPQQHKITNPTYSAPINNPSTSSYSKNSATQGSSHKHERVWFGDVTSLCARYSNPRQSDTITWFTISNGCNESIKVWTGNDEGASTIFGSLMELGPGSSDKSWWLNTKYRGIRYLACKSTVEGHDVFLDKATSHCYYNN
jgi:hypothetical protein